MDAARVAQAGYDGMMKGKVVAIPGLRNKMIPVAARLAPRQMVAKLSHRAARPSEK
jgi:short-subunit dehydrogenase